MKTSKVNKRFVYNLKNKILFNKIMLKRHAKLFRTLSMLNLPKVIPMNEHKVKLYYCEYVYGK